mmetsp:Transcript_4639/g.6927  ORF Transcript_4639/g.6927 Transcript_4639/m.6927 type:complete len:145 (-) Transcript_4639:796-1230(-)
MDSIRLIQCGVIILLSLYFAFVSNPNANIKLESVDVNVNEEISILQHPEEIYSSMDTSKTTVCSFTYIKNHTSLGLHSIKQTTGFPEENNYFVFSQQKQNSINDSAWIDVEDEDNFIILNVRNHKPKRKIYGCNMLCRVYSSGE